MRRAMPRQPRLQPTPLRCAPGLRPAARGGVRLSRRPVRRSYDFEINSDIDAFGGPYPFRDGRMFID